MFPFFKKLENAKTKKVRIMHYGDSQIEGDRISGRLRERLQKEFGGNGAGLSAVIPATRKISLKNIPSTNWVRKQDLDRILIKVSNIKNMVLYFLFVRWN